MRVVLKGLKNGSVIVDYDIITNAADNFTVANISQDFNDALNQSSVLVIDPKLTTYSAQNSCAVEFNRCSQYATCTSNMGVSTCKCNPGYYDFSPSAPGIQCELDECSTGSNTCSLNATCTKIVGGYTCQCNSGFQDQLPTSPGRFCTEINECTNGNNNCSQLASCTNTVGSYTCNCYPGIQDQNLTNPGRDCLDPVLCFSKATFCSPSSSCLDSKNVICASNQAFPSSVQMKDKDFTSDLYDASSQAYINLAHLFTVNLTDYMKTTLNVTNFQIIVVGFRKGSVVAHFTSLINSSDSISFDQFQKALNSGMSKISGDFVLNVMPPITTTGTTTPSDNTWRTATIIVAVLLGAFLLIVVILAAVWIYTKNRMGSFSPMKDITSSMYRHL
ncbi:hemicentin-1-like [Rana temporaria]|uniref:hemicentin-1-like n=1 Tax=Rana temporaria TaxID=8407 RepID=UPI001AACDB16|nr:hemicentin-1-like [Rana temporaria]